MSRQFARRRLFAGAVSILAVGLTAPAALALEEGPVPAVTVDDPTPTATPTATATATATPTPTPTATPDPGLLPVTPDEATPTPSPTPTPAPTPTGREVDPRYLPDLRLGRVSDVRLLRSSGRLQLRFSSTLLNYGPHALRVRAVRPKQRGKFVVAQRVRQVNRHWTWRELPVGTVYAGDGHSHQHLKDIVRYRMYLVDADGNRVEEDKRRARKIGFCIYDNVKLPKRPKQPNRPVFPRSGCGKKTSKKLTMGLSVGWGDLYNWRLPGQYVSLAKLPSGVYTLIGEANPEGVLYEQKTTNNGVFMEFRLSRGGGKPARIKILDKGYRRSEKAVANVSSHDGHSDHSDHPEGADAHDAGIGDPPADLGSSAVAAGSPARPVATLASRRRGRLTTRHGLRREHP